MNGDNNVILRDTFRHNLFTCKLSIVKQKSQIHCVPIIVTQVTWMYSYSSYCAYHVQIYIIFHFKA